ncbi:hypothetical protein OAN61_00090 [bacterium]|nr:hypothetical protein [bacterium]
MLSSVRQGRSTQVHARHSAGWGLLFLLKNRPLKSVAQHAVCRRPRQQRQGYGLWLSCMRLIHCRMAKIGLLRRAWCRTRPLVLKKLSITI